EAPGIVDGGTLCKSGLDRCLVGFTGADDAGPGPDRIAPFPFLDDFGIGGEDQFANVRERVAAPVAKFGDALVDMLCSAVVAGGGVGGSGHGGTPHIFSPGSFAACFS